MVKAATSVARIRSRNSEVLGGAGFWKGLFRPGFTVRAQAQFAHGDMVRVEVMDHGPMCRCAPGGIGLKNGRASPG